MSLISRTRRRTSFRRQCWLLALVVLYLSNSPSIWGSESEDQTSDELALDRLIADMTVAEKLGQMSLRGFSSRSKEDPRVLEDAVRAGQVGALINVMDRAVVDRLQEIAVRESPHGIPLLFGRDVIHGFQTIFPIPLGQTASWNPELVRQVARISAQEASTYGIRWTFAPMVDIARDPRWGRIAESPGEDPLLAERMAVAMVVGFQGDSLTASDSLAACVKHFAGYGAAEGGRDYNGAQISEALLRNVYLRPFAAALEAGAASVMTGFHEVNGVPATADPFLLRQVLREEWEFRGLVVSDWNSVTEMIAHGFAADAGEAARFSALAGVDLEMISRSFEEHLPELVARGLVPMNTLDQAVRNVLRVKQRLGLFQRPERDDKRDGELQTASALALAREAARQSLVLVKNRGVLPLSDEQRIAVIGPLAEAPHEQLGTWAFDGRADTTQTPLSALRRRLGDNRVAFAPGLANSRTLSSDGFDAVIAAAESAETILFFGGEEAILSGEAHSRADLRLPGAQEELVQRLADLGKPLVLVVMSGRPNTLEALLESSDAVLIAWHPGTMGGPAIADVLFGDTSPSGRLPVTWPIDAGQIPIYYNHNNTGRPAPDTLQSFMDIPVGAWQSSLSNTSRYLDLGTRPRFPFGYGLTYGQFEYSDLSVSEKTVTREGSVRVTVLLRNVGSRSATEVVQLYSRDPVARLARPVRELRDFQRITLDPGQSQPVSFDLAVSDLAFYDGDGRLGVEPGRIDLFVGPNAQEGESASFEIIAVGDAKSTEVRRKMSDANK